MKKEPIITKNFILLFLFSVMVCTAMNMLNVIVPLFVTENLNQTTAVAGLMTTVYTIAACASRPINGMLTDRLGRQRMMAAGTLLFAAGCLIGGLFAAILVLTICRILMGIGYSAATTANNTASTDVIPESRLAEGIGYFGMSQSVASAFGPALAAIIVSSIGSQNALLFDGSIALLAFAVALSIRYEASQPSRQIKTDASKQKTAFFESSAILPSLYQGLSLFLISCLMCFMTLYIVSKGLSSAVAGSFFAVASVMIIGIRLTCSGLMNRFQASTLLIPGYLLLIITCLILPFADTTGAFLGCGVLYGLAHGIIWMTLGSEAVRFAPAEKRGAANATFYFAFDAAIGIGAAFWGMMIDNIGYIKCFYLIAGSTVLLLLTIIPVFRHRMKILE
jgi:predicted MFS family arabinose efflux permease